MNKIQIKIVPIDSIRGAEYNPRRADEQRLNIVRLSLSKMGWLLPVFIDSTGLILSGHQRTKMARALGYTKIPVTVYNPPARKGVSAEEIEKAANLMFNRCTNDMRKEDTSKDILARLKDELHFEKLAAIPDRSPNDAKTFRCLFQKELNVDHLLSMTGAVPEDLIQTAVTADAAACNVPIVVTKSGKVVNGAGRVALASRQGHQTIWGTVIEDHEEAIANAFLNLLSMDFDVSQSYANILRYNSFRRVAGARGNLGQGFVFMLPNSVRTHFDLAANASLWKQTYGQTVLDFGAGQRQESNMLNEAGVNCIPFEPYCLKVNSDVLDLDLSQRVAQNFLNFVAKGTEFNSIFLSSVLQSVPFPEDRMHVMAIIHALTSARTTFYVCAKSRKSAAFVSAETGRYKESSVSGCGFRPDHEEGVTMADITKLPKLQKFYLTSEFEAMMEPFWIQTKIWEAGNYIYAVCARPRAIDKERLRKAIEFEFNLPYPENRSLGMVGPAIEAFTKRGCL